MTLVVSRRTRRRARVVSANGRSVAGALVRIRKPSVGLVNDVATGPSGDFEISAPAQDAYVDVIVTAPGFPVKTARIGLSGEDDSRQMVLGRRGGRVFVPSEGALAADHRRSVGNDSTAAQDSPGQRVRLSVRRGEHTIPMVVTAAPMNGAQERLWREGLEYEQQRAKP